MAPPLGSKSAREYVKVRRDRVVWLTNRGWSAAEIGVELRISPRTVVRMRASARDGRRIGKPVSMINQKRNERRRAKMASCGGH
jgi:hypothetical protein